MRIEALGPVLLLVVAITGGCVSEPKATTAGNMTAIDSALARGPVFVDFGATWCSWCEKEKPVVQGLAGEYTAVTFLSVDTDQDTALADAFSVEGIPQMAIIVKKKADGSYVYIGPDGKATTDRYSSRIIGYREAGELRPLLDAAAAAR